MQSTQISMHSHSPLNECDETKSNRFNTLKVSTELNNQTIKPILESLQIDAVL